MELTTKSEKTDVEIEESAACCVDERIIECHDENAGCNEREVKPVEVIAKQNWKYRIKKELLGNTKFNQRSEIYKSVLAAIILAVSVGLSLIEPKGVTMPWGGDLDYRIFDTLLLFIGIRMIGLLYCFIDAALLPWIHVAIDGAHSPISMVGFMITDLLCVFVFWLIYYRLFKVGLEKECYTQDISEDDIIAGKRHKHQFKKQSWTRKIIAMIIVIIICSFIEGLCQIGVFALFYNNAFQPKEDDKDALDGLATMLRGINVLWTILFFAGIFSFKYIVECAIFLVIEKRTAIIADHYGVF